MRIVLDGMGGDHAPHEMVKGAVQAAEMIEDDIYITGKEELIQAELKKMGYEGDQIHIVNAEEVITMEDSPVKAIRRKSDSSMVVGLNMIKEGTGDVLISGGNTGALVVGSRLILGRIEGIDRPVLASVYPCMGKEPSILVDAGASSEAKAHNLVEYGLMGSIFMEHVWGRENPRVGLVNLGVEESKGTSMTKDAFKKLKKAPVNFVGNVEAREGVAMSIMDLLKTKLMQNVKSKMAAMLLKPQLKSLKKEFDYEEYGGAPILGVDGPVLKIHGSSTANAVRNAIIKSVPYSKENVVEIIRQSMLELEEVIEKDEEEYAIHE